MASYDYNELERLLPFVWDETAAWGIPPAEEIEEGMPRVAGDKSHQNTHWAVLADLRLAWDLAGLTAGQQQALLLRYGMDMTLELAASELGITKQSVDERVHGGIKKMLAFLGCDDTDDIEELD